jgi:prepilin-type N-terminal cleavage/methylation domain-containing protein
MLLRHRAQQEGGFTLVELLVAIVVSGIVMGGLATGFVAALGSTKGIHDQFIESNDAHLLSTTFTSEVQSADPTKTDVLPGTPTGCASSPATGTNILRLHWSETSSTGTTYFSVAYRTNPPLTPGPGEMTDGTLTRYFCSGSNLATESATVRVVVKNLITTAQPTVNQVGTTIKLNLMSKSGKPYSLTASTRTPGSLKFLVSVAGAPKAGESFFVKVQASSDGTTKDTTYNGPKDLDFSGVSASPGGLAPQYPDPAVPVSFSAGEADVEVTVYKSGSSTLLVTEGPRQGSVAMNVAAASVPLGFSVCPPATATNTTTALRVTRGTDIYGNPDPNAGAPVTIGLSATGGTFTPASLTINAGATQTSGTSNYKTPLSAGVPVKLTATGTGYTAVECEFTTTGASVAPVFIIDPIANQVAGVPFNVTIKASTDGTTTDTTYAGSKTLVFSGPTNAPNGNAPVYPLTVSFSNGLATAQVTLFNAATTTLTVTEGTRTGSGTLAVSAAPVQLQFDKCPTAVKGAVTSGITVSRLATDAYGNADSKAGSPITVTLAANEGSFSSTSLTIPANQPQASGSVTFTNPSGNNKQVTVTAQSAGYLNASCTHTTS